MMNVNVLSSKHQAQDPDMLKLVHGRCVGGE